MFHGIQCHWQHSTHSPYLAAQRKLSDKGGVGKVLVVYLAHTRKYRNGNRKVMSRAGLFNVCRSKINSNPALGEIDLRRAECRGYPLLGFSYGYISQAHYFKPFNAPAYLNLNVHAESVHSEKSYTFYF